MYWAYTPLQQPSNLQQIKQLTFSNTIFPLFSFYLEYNILKKYAYELPTNT